MCINRIHMHSRQTVEGVAAEDTTRGASGHRLFPGVPRHPRHLHYHAGLRERRAGGVAGAAAHHGITR